MVNEPAPVEPDDGDDVDVEAPSTDFEDADEDEDEAAAEPVYSTDETSLDEARYNARDCLSMCRIYPFLLEAVQRTQTVDVYLLDRALAHIALQMTRCGMPIDIEERARVGAHLRELRATVLVELRKYVEGESRDAFILWATQYMAAKARLKDPKVGEMNDATGTVHSYESALLARMAIRKVEFEKVLAKKGVNYGAKIQQAALLRAAGVALMKLTPKTGLPKIDKETLEGTAYNPASKALLNFILTDTTIRNYIEGEQQTKKKKGKSIVVEADGRLHPDWSIHKITGRWGSSPNCFDGETEILTRDGWIYFNKLRPGAEVAQFWKDDSRIEFVKPTRIYKGRYRGDMISLQRRNIDLLVTPEHRQLFKRRDGDWEDCLARDFVGDRMLPTAGEYAFTGAPDVNPAVITFLCAAQADGNWNGSGWKFGLSRGRKIARLRGTLLSLGVPFSEACGVSPDPFKPGKTRRRTTFYVKKCDVGDTTAKILGKRKVFGSWLLGWNHRSVGRLLDEVMFWDGSFTRRNCYSSSMRENADWVQTLFVLTGRRARLRPYTASAVQKKVNWQVDVAPRPFTWTTGTKKTRVPWRGRMVYCVTVPSSYIVVRRGQNVMISGQCQNWSKRAGGGAENLRRMVAAPPGYILVGADQKQLEARLIAGCSQDPFLLNVFANNEDIHGAVAGAAFPTWPMLVKVYEEHKPLHKLARQRGFGCGASAEQPYCEHCKQRDKVRDLVKRLEYGAFYGGSAETLWTRVVKDFPDLKLALVQEFMHQIGVKMAGVMAWRDRELAEALRTGEIRSPILGRREVFPMGRVEPTVIYNFKPQSGGADLWGLGAIEFAKRWDQAGDEARLFHNGHDSVLILTKEKHLAEVERDVHLCWERRWNNVDFLMDCKSGARWSEV